ncbi:uncharacterized protein LOC119688776 [Teleopsis dalmanni]|uniref:uncharacterized protein LOC119688776 n=1 Tax=Teleopsis dalmanni TaxID=139649 RepID=UPI0018CD3CF0|nr:uncharacterized protein LOC119688776 [Teleopsis dalmanni]
MSTKFINVLSSLYTENRAAVWDGEHLSEWFATVSGVKQGCVLSPILFSIYIDDVVTHLSGGAFINGVNIKALLYADDIVLLAESPNCLQIMINELHSYCKLWGLTVNIEKSKALVFKKHHRRYTNEEVWTLGGENVEIVKEYKYLGTWMYYNATFNRHLTEKLREAKKAINCSSIMCYAAQVWGVLQYEEVEKLLRFFVKKIWRLPLNTPNRMIYLETGLSPLYLYTLEIHFKYMLKVCNMESSRLPKILAISLMQEKSHCFKTWTELASVHREPLIIDNIHSWKHWQQNILVKIGIAFREKFVAESRQSLTRVLHRQLNYDLGNNSYFADRFSAEAIGCIFKTRGELLKLNNAPYMNSSDPRCTLCNTGEKEDVIHFLSKCPILMELRVNYFGKQTLDINELMRLLNGENWHMLSIYVKTASRYRENIILEAF